MLDRRALILAVSLAMGLGGRAGTGSELARSVLSYGIATGNLTAIVLNLLLPKRAAAQA